ncbi:hypothetical protein CDAR_184261 [Caerostris darwini]|uniref:C2H2-type domain-containing protein n=1 Tax=Caerostris darwini TaxID=1538125 RepID=A0AAV4MNA8_9ARAC|nr:hypothetical protein CDAR_184261 [Caerostris darwini]
MVVVSHMEEGCSFCSDGAPNKNKVLGQRKRNKKTDDKNVNKCQNCWEIVDSFVALTIHLRQHSFRENGIA